MKYVVLAVCLLGLSGCSSKPSTFVCFNPFNVIQSIEIASDGPNVVVHAHYLKVTTQDGNIVYIPRSLCAEVLRAETN